MGEFLRPLLPGDEVRDGITLLIVIDDPMVVLARPQAVVGVGTLLRGQGRIVARSEGRCGRDMRRIPDAYGFVRVEPGAFGLAGADCASVSGSLGDDLLRAGSEVISIIGRYGRHYITGANNFHPDKAGVYGTATCNAPVEGGLPLILRISPGPRTLLGSDPQPAVFLI
jgi:hypothetical protein